MSAMKLLCGPGDLYRVLRKDCGGIKQRAVVFSTVITMAYSNAVWGAGGGEA